MDEDEFSATLPDDLKKPYLSKKKEISKRINTKYKNEKEFLSNSKKAHIDSDAKHRELINSCVFPFTKVGSLANTGYRYIRAAPLMEYNVKNMDFLIFKNDPERPIAIFGECKGGVSHINSIINEINTAKGVINSHINEVKSNYLKIPVDRNIQIDYVIAVPSSDVPEVLKAVIESREELIVWHAPSAGNQELSLAYPPNDGAVEIRKMIHKDNSLNDKLRHAQTNRKAFNYFQQGHPFSQLYSLLSAIENTEEGKIINKDRLKMNIFQDLFYAEEKVNDTVDFILQKGVDIDFLAKNTVTGTYTIKPHIDKPERLALVLKEKWVANQIREDKEQEINGELSQVKAAITEDLRKREEEAAKQQRL